jgi:hypothetical protein
VRLPAHCCRLPSTALVGLRGPCRGDSSRSSRADSSGQARDQDQGTHKCVCVRHDGNSRNLDILSTLTSSTHPAMSGRLLHTHPDCRLTRPPLCGCNTRSSGARPACPWRCTSLTTRPTVAPADNADNNSVRVQGAPGGLPATILEVSVTTNYGRSLDDDGEKSEHEAKVGSCYVAIRALHCLACLVRKFLTDRHVRLVLGVCLR